MPYSVFYLYNSQYDKNFEAHRAGRVPKHRFFGFMDMAEQGHVSLWCPLPKLLKGKLYRPILFRFYQAFVALRRQSKLDCIVATHEACALPVLLLKRLRLLKTPVIVVNVALLQSKNLQQRSRKWMWRKLLPSADAILSYCSAQLDWLRDEYGIDPQRLNFVPLGVDVDYFQTQERQNAPNSYCLAVGTNTGKDYQTLVQALPEHIPLIVITDRYNARIISECVKPSQQIKVFANVAPDFLKKYYEGATLLVIPLREDKISSGQTVLLENMALGKTVIISDVSSIRDYVENQVTAITVPPGDAAAMHKAIAAVWDNPSSFEQVGTNAARRVRLQFSSRLFAERLTAMIQQLAA